MRVFMHVGTNSSMYICRYVRMHIGMYDYYIYIDIYIYICIRACT